MTIEALHSIFGCSKCEWSNKEWRFFKATRRAMANFQPNSVENH